MRGDRRMSSVGSMSHPQSYEAPPDPRPQQDADRSPRAADPLGGRGRHRRYGASGYPRYAGEGMEADIDPETRTVEAVLIDGDELDPGMSVQVAEGMRPAG